MNGQNIRLAQKRGLQPLGGRRMLVGVRLRPDQFAALDAWIMAAPGAPTRPETVRPILKGCAKVTEAQTYFSTCVKCGGSGTFAPAAVALGNGWSQQFPGPCPDCAGSGAIPTSEGRNILSLVQRFSRHGRLEFPQ